MTKAAAKNNPWAVCHASTGDDKAAFEACVLKVKSKMGLHASMTEEEYLAIMKFGEIEAEIFEEGIHGDRNYSQADLLQLQKNFDEFGRDLIQPPMVLGHDEKQTLLQNSGLPAAGWLKDVVTKIKENGKMSVIGKFFDVPDIIKKVIQSRKYKRISSEIYENFANPNLDGGKPKGLSFRRIALLGADVPEVKTLADVNAFGEGTGKFLYTEHEGEPTMTAEEIKAMEDRIAAAVGKAHEAKFTKFQEEATASISGLKKENDDLKAANASLSQDFARSVIKERATGISSFIEAQKASGRILPAWEEKGLKKFMESLDDKKVAKFAEGATAVEQSPLAFFQDFVKALPKVALLTEQTTQDLEAVAAAKGQKVTGDKGVALDRETRKYIESEKKAGIVLKYAEALRAVSIAHPELVNAD